MNDIILNALSTVLKNGKVYIPVNLTHVKLDIGLAWNAPNTEYWLEREDNLCVFGFEPSTRNHRRFIEENEQTRNEFPNNKVVKAERIHNTFFPIQCALSKGEPRKQNFYVTGNDTGCSSLFEPSYFPVQEQEEVAVISLKDFFDLFPWEQIPYIDQVKIDAQGSDCEIIQGAEKYLNNIVYLSFESSTDDQYRNVNDFHILNTLLPQYGFDVVDSKGADIICLNRNHKDKIENINFFIEGS
jgi:FkbM family methyltransferase